MLAHKSQHFLKNEESGIEALVYKQALKKIGRGSMRKIARRILT
jgi:hypothetical protein